MPQKKLKPLTLKAAKEADMCINQINGARYRAIAFHGEITHRVSAELHNESHGIIEALETVFNRFRDLRNKIAAENTTKDA